LGRRDRQTRSVYGRSTYELQTLRLRSNMHTRNQIKPQLHSIHRCSCPTALARLCLLRAGRIDKGMTVALVSSKTTGSTSMSKSSAGNVIILPVEIQKRIIHLALDAFSPCPSKTLSLIADPNLSAKANAERRQHVKRVICCMRVCKSWKVGMFCMIRWGNANIAIERGDKVFICRPVDYGRGQLLRLRRMCEAR
jgi:hypothetical protein